MVHGRQKRSSELQIVHWAVHKNESERLLRELTNNVSVLVEIAPAQKQEALCQAEIRKIDVDGNSGVLKEILRPFTDGTSVDNMLRDSIIKSLRDGGEGTVLSWKNADVGEEAKVYQGKRVAAGYQGPGLGGHHVYTTSDSKIGKKATFFQGVTYGGSTSGW